MIITAYYKGFHIDADPATTGDEDLKAAKGFCELLISEGFVPSWNPETTKQALAPETPATPAPTASQATSDLSALCPVHGTQLVWKSGTSTKTGKPYGFWACPTKNADGSFCKAGGAK